MTKKERILKKIESDRDIQKAMKGNSFYSNKEFYYDALRYIKAIKEGRMICNIDTVSASGMSRTIKFLSCEKGNGTWHNYLNYFVFFQMLGYTPRSKHSDYFRIHGCGMDMIFHTNYTIIHGLRRLGFISAKQCGRLAQDTPPVV